MVYKYHSTAQLICCTEALLTVLVRDLSKEEEQVFPLLVEHFDAVEQANLVWQFLCSMAKHSAASASSLTTPAPNHVPAGASTSVRSAT
ncbi:unnamed protein product [Closterium sp. Yama58-4]|nr:unnamed protein product [Closterium sp. Yama58-4]